VAREARPPIEWSESKNIRWKTAILGRGHGPPIVWGDRVFLTTAIPVGETLKPKRSGRPGEHDNLPVESRCQFVVMAISRADGKVLWSRTVREALPVEAGHYTASLASASPVTDGQRVIAHFGSHGLYCQD
jgi:hypothetical protein